MNDKNGCYSEFASITWWLAVVSKCKLSEPEKVGHLCSEHLDWGSPLIQRFCLPHDSQYPTVMNRSFFSLLAGIERNRWVPEYSYISSNTSDSFRQTSEDAARRESKTAPMDDAFFFTVKIVKRYEIEILKDSKSTHDMSRGSNQFKHLAIGNQWRTMKTSDMKVVCNRTLDPSSFFKQLFHGLI